MTTESTLALGGPDPAEVSDFPVQGMSCASCVGRVERALASVPGVQQAHVNLATQRATVRFDPDLTDPRALAHAVEAAGYVVPAFALEPAGTKKLGARERARAMAEAEQQAEQALRRDFLVACAFSLPLLVLAMSHGHIPGSAGELGRVLQLALATPVMFGPGARFLRLAWGALQKRATDMNTLVAMGALSAYGYSATAVLAPGWLRHGIHLPPLYFEAGAAIITFVLLGKLLEQRARRRLSAAVSGLGALIPQQATRIVPGASERQESVDVDLLSRGDWLLVRAGERVPNDGVVLRGEAAVDESMLTGESLPVDKTTNSKVFGGTLLSSGALTVRVTRVGKDTALARIVDAVEQAQGTRAPIARLADRVSAYFVPVVFGIACLTFVVWLALDPSGAGFSFAVARFVTVLVIACPCALGLATPAAVAVGTARGAELGVLIKGGDVLEAASQLQTLLFDKTGTLTEGKPAVTEVLTLDGHSEDQLLSWLAAVELQSEHPLARAIVEAARARGLSPSTCENFVSRAGLGAEARVEGRLVRIGNAAWLAEGRVATEALERQAEQLAARGRTPSFVAIDGKLAGLVALADRPRADVASALSALKQQGFVLAMITGDRASTAHAVARELGIEQVFAEVRPEDKARIVSEQKRGGRRVAMVGDGINDAPALASADVGIAVGSATDVALATADMVLLRGGIPSLSLALGLCRATLHTIRQNLFWAFLYNLVGIPLAAGVLYPSTGWLLSPLFASAAMSLSSVSVLANSLRLRRYRVQADVSLAALATEKS